MPPRQASACVCTSLRGAARAMTKFYDDALAPSGLLITQYALLRQVHDAGEAALGELAGAMEMDQSTLTRNVRPLVRDGLVRVAARAGDRRTRVVSLTARGRAALETARPLWREAQRRMKDRLGEERWTAVRETLDLLRA